MFEPGLEPGAPVRIELTDAEVDASILERPLPEGHATRKSLKLIGFMVRPC